MPVTFYAMSGSLYSAKPRAYMRHFHVPYVERGPGDPRYGSVIMPAIGRFIIPVIETADGRIIQDSTDILDHFQQSCPDHPRITPPGGLWAALSHLLSFYGSEGMLRPAMHYRWNFDDTNMAFIRRDFSGSLRAGGSAAEQDTAFAVASGRMRAATLALGATPEAVPAVEASYAEFLRLFDAHLQDHPFLLGGRVSEADFGFFAPLYAHLGRDPYPAMLMKQTAWRVWRWVERVGAPAPDMIEYADPPEDFLCGTEVPETLKALLRFIAEDFRDMILAEVAAVSEAGMHAEPGALCARHRVVGQVNITWRGVPQTLGAYPYHVFMLQRLQDCVDGLDADARALVRALFEETGLAALLDARPARRVARRDNREVWGELRGEGGGKV